MVELDVCTGTCMRTLLGHSRSLTAIWVSNMKQLCKGTVKFADIISLIPQELHITFHAILYYCSPQVI